MLKKIIAMLLVLAFAFSLAACGGTETEDASNQSGTQSDVAVQGDESDIADAGSEEGKTEDESKTADAGSKVQQTASSGGGNKNDPSKPGATLGNQDKVNQAANDDTAGTVSIAPPTPPRAPNIKSAVKGITVKKGKSICQKVDFKGKTFTMAVTAEEGNYHTSSLKRTIAAFEKEYNCKIKVKSLTMATYNQQVAQAIAGGDPYEICYAHGSMFPACAIDNLYEDLIPYLRTDDLIDNDDPTAGGVDLAKSTYFAYKGKLYGTCNFSSAFPYVIYYNKYALAKEGYSGNKDLRKLADAGSSRWNWNAIFQMGKRLTDAGSDKYFLSNSFSGRGISLSYGAPIIKVDNGKYSQNITSKAFLESLKVLQRIFVGNNKIAEPRDTTHAYNSYETTLKGNCYLFLEETSKYLDISIDVKKSAAFNRDKKNIGLVRLPLGETNETNAYPTGWLTAVCASRGTDPRVAIAWEVFRSSYKDPIIDSNAMSKEDQAYTDTFMAGDICCEVGKFATSDTEVLRLTEYTVIPNIIKGADISAQVTAVKDQMTACIESTVGKQ